MSSVTISNPSAAGANPSNEVAVFSSVKVMTNGDVVFTAVGDVQILNLYSECQTPNGVAATTVAYSITPTVGSVTTISGPSASIASAPAGALITLPGSALGTAARYASTGVDLGTSQTAGGILFPSGTLTLVVATGPTTGTWKHYLRYRPLEPNAYVIPS